MGVFRGLAHLGARSSMSLRREGSIKLAARESSIALKEATSTPHPRRTIHGLMSLLAIGLAGGTAAHNINKTNNRGQIDNVDHSAPTKHSMLRRLGSSRLNRCDSLRKYASQAKKK